MQLQGFISGRDTTLQKALGIWDSREGRPPCPEVWKLPCHQCAQCFSCRTICDTKGDICCSVCKGTNRACYKKGENVGVPRNQQCHTCYTYNVKCDGKSPCSSCLSRRYQCRPQGTSLSRGKGVPPDQKCHSCFRSNRPCNGESPCDSCIKYKRLQCQPQESPRVYTGRGVPPEQRCYHLLLLEKDLQWRIALRYVHQAQGSTISTSGGNAIIFIALVRYLSTA